ncbi:cysteine desulfurase [Malassezia sp. CBS 17886]|nr:cysteine desulfurase [Malassezia sp. CBS 17886]
MAASRTELIAWVNELLGLNYTKVEQCGSGAAYAQVIDSIYGNVPMSRINFAAKHEYEFLSNYKVLQNVFVRNKVDKGIPVDRLVRCKMQDNLEFLQWLKKFWDMNYVGEGLYDAEGRRGAQPIAAAASGGVSGRRMSTAAPQARARAAAGPRPSTVRPRPSAAAPRPSVADAGSARRVSMAGRARPPPPVAIPNEAITQLTSEIDEMKISVDSLERERDFYFGKLRDVEVIVQERLAALSRGEPANDGSEAQDGSDGAASGPETDTLKHIQGVLYKTEEGFELPDAAEEVAATVSGHRTDNCGAIYGLSPRDSASAATGPGTKFGLRVRPVRFVTVAMQVVRASVAHAARGYVVPARPVSATVSPTDVKVEREARPVASGKDLPEVPEPADGVLFQDVLSEEKQPRQANRPIYLDAQSTTPVDPRVLDAMMPYYINLYGNPHSRTHAYGWESEMATDTARKHIADLVNADPKELIFTSGATESNNMLIKGVANFYRSKKNHIITTQTEHKCVLDSCRALQERGFEVTYLPVQTNGQIDLEELRKALRPTTALVSIMAVNNEIGVIQPIKAIGEMLKTYGAELAKELGRGTPKPFFHTDAAQAVGKIPIDVNEAGIDLMSMSSHKLYGPKGLGAAYVRRRPRVRLEPLISGGGQERGLRSGTLATPLVVGFGEAARLAKEEMSYDHAHISALAKRLRENIMKRVDMVMLNGDLEGYPGCTNLTFQYIEGESLLMALKDICLSSGSACTSASLEPSYVLRALGLDDENAHSSLRFGIDRFTTVEEIDFVCDKIVQVVNRLRELSPLWEMYVLQACGC